MVQELQFYEKPATTLKFQHGGPTENNRIWAHVSEPTAHTQVVTELL